MDAGHPYHVLHYPLSVGSYATTLAVISRVKTKKGKLSRWGWCEQLIRQRSHQSWSHPTTKFCADPVMLFNVHLHFGTS